MEKIDNLIDERQLSKILGQAVQTLRNHRHYGRGLPYIKIGRSVRYRLSDITKYVEQHRIDPERKARG